MSDAGALVVPSAGGRRQRGFTDNVLPVVVDQVGWDSGRCGAQIALHADLFFSEVAGYLEDLDEMDLPWQRGVRFDNRALARQNGARLNAWLADVRQLARVEGLEVILEEPEGQGAWYASQTDENGVVLDHLHCT